MSHAKLKKNSNRHLKWIRLIHSYSAMAVLISMLFFAFTGITLNHRDWFSSDSKTSIREFPLPEEIFAKGNTEIKPVLEAEKVRDWLVKEHDLLGKNIALDWDEDERLLSLDVKRPGGYSFAEIDVSERIVVLESNDYGAIALMNDLHMGRNSGSAWSLFIDLSSIAMLLFSLTGLWLVLPQKRRKNKLFLVGLLGFVAMSGFYFMAF